MKNTKILFIITFLFCYISYGQTIEIGVVFDADFSNLFGSGQAWQNINESNVRSNILSYVSADFDPLGIDVIQGQSDITIYISGGGREGIGYGEAKSGIGSYINFFNLSGDPIYAEVYAWKMTSEYYLQGSYATLARVSRCIANHVSHEAGHLLNLRHAHFSNSFNPVLSGALNGDYLPNEPNETYFPSACLNDPYKGEHIMVKSPSFINIDQLASVDLYFSDLELSLINFALLRGGNITRNTTWGICNKTFIQNCNITIESGKTFIIAGCGYTHNLNGYSISGGTIEVHGTLQNDNVQIKSGAYFIGLYPSFSTDMINNAQSGQTIIIKSGSYIINQNIVVPYGVTFKINSGVELQFNNTKLTINGALNADGVTFKGNGTTPSWFGIEVNGNIEYFHNCTVKEAEYGLFLNMTGIEMNYCTFLNNENHIYLYYSNGPRIEYCNIYNNTHNWTELSGIECEYYSTPEVLECVFQEIQDGSAVIVDNTSIPLLGGDDQGWNSFRNNYYDICSSYQGAINAQENWWGSNPPSPDISGNVDYSNWLLFDPHPPLYSFKNGNEDKVFALSGNNRKFSINSDIEPEIKILNEANLLIAKKKYNEVINVLEQLTLKYDDGVPCRLAIVLIEKCLNKIGLSNKIIDKLSCINDKSNSKFIDSRKLNLMIKNNDYDEALSLSEEIIRTSNDSSVIKLSMHVAGNICFYNKKEKNKGENYLREIIKRFPESPLSRSALSTLGEWKPKNRNSSKPSNESGNIISELEIKNYPNPFNPSTKIEYSLPENTNVNIIIYNSLGQEIAKLVDGFKEKGVYSITWNPNNMSSGIYYYKIRTDKSTLMNKMIFMK